MNTVNRDAVNKERTDEARLDDALASGAEKAAVMIGERDEAIRRAQEAIALRDQRIKELESQDEELVGVVSQGSVARAERISRKQNALNALQKAGVVVGLLFIIGLAYKYPYPFAGNSPAQVAPLSTEAPPAGFLQRSVA